MQFLGFDYGFYIKVAVRSRSTWFSSRERTVTHRGRLIQCAPGQNGIAVAEQDRIEGGLGRVVGE